MAYQGTSLCSGVFGKDAAETEYHLIFSRIVSIEFERKSFTLSAPASFLASVLLEIITFILT